MTLPRWPGQDSNRGCLIDSVTTRLPRPSAFPLLRSSVFFSFPSLASANPLYSSFAPPPTHPYLCLSSSPSFPPIYLTLGARQTEGATWKFLKCSPFTFPSISLRPSLPLPILLFSFPSTILLCTSSYFCPHPLPSLYISAHIPFLITPTIPLFLLPHPPSLVLTPSVSTYRSTNLYFFSVTLNTSPFPFSIPFCFIINSPSPSFYIFHSFLFLPLLLRLPKFSSLCFLSLLSFISLLSLFSPTSSFFFPSF